jgi:amidase
VPAAVNGIYGFKPTANRLPDAGQRGCHNPNFRPIVPSAGPLSNDLDALELLTRLVLDSRPTQLDHTALDLPWRRIDDSGSSKLRFGFVPETATFPLHPRIQRILNETAQIPKECGHEVVMLEADECVIDDAGKLCNQLFALDHTALGHLQTRGGSLRFLL